MIQNINVNKLVNHPDNPRKDLGDLSDLTDSIKTQGILQNLTVVPGEGDTYVVVIGNRRLAAAKQAGLEELPCKIADMEYKDQISTMLLENMQRQDLTLYEQVQGFQMMLDLGVSISDICTTTGLAETTVRRRVKMAELDQDILKDRVDNNVTIEELVMLEKIDDEDEKNRLLQLAATNNFKWEYNLALRKQENDKKVKNILKLLDEIVEGKCENFSHSDYSRVESIGFETEETFVIETKEDLRKTVEETGEKLFYLISRNSVDIYERAKKTEETEEDEEERDRVERKEKLENVFESVKNQWKTFAAELTNTALKQKQELILKELCFSIGFDDWGVYGSYGTQIKKFLVETGKAEETGKVFLEEYVAKNYLRILFLELFFEGFPRTYEQTWGWLAHFDLQEDLELFWNFLKSMGYVPSDEETRFMTGTHELYRTEDECEGEEQDD